MLLINWALSIFKCKQSDGRIQRFILYTHMTAIKMRYMLKDVRQMAAP